MDFEMRRKVRQVIRLPWQTMVPAIPLSREYFWEATLILNLMVSLQQLPMVMTMTLFIHLQEMMRMALLFPIL